MLGCRRSYACLGSTAFVSVDALGTPAFRWSLSRSGECCSWSYVVSHWVPVSCATQRHGPRNPRLRHDGRQARLDGAPVAGAGWLLDAMTIATARAAPAPLEVARALAPRIRARADEIE